MGWQIQRNIWERSKQKGNVLLVLLALGDFANEVGTAWPSLSTLSKKCRLSIRQVQKNLRILEKSGEIRIETGGKGTRNTSRYFLLPGNGEDRNITQTDINHEGKDEPSDIQPRENDTQIDTLRMSASSSNPLINHQKQEVFQTPPAKTKSHKSNQTDLTRLKHQADPLLENQAVSLYRGLVRLTPNPTQRQLIAEKVKDQHLWEETLQHWLSHGWSKTNVLGMLEFYSKGGARFCSSCAMHNTSSKNGSKNFAAPSPSQPLSPEVIKELREKIGRKK